MLSRNDIEQELGKEISIYPLDFKNFKENSINLCASHHAWALQDHTVFYDPHTDCFSVSKAGQRFLSIPLSKGNSAVYTTRTGKQYILLLPNATTLIETEEVLSVGSGIGGTYHSKVGLVSQGIGHIGTMLGPNFSGNSLVALHNHSADVIALPVGKSFVSVVFHYLDTPMTEKNPTVSGHLDKMAELGINLTEEDREELGADWRTKFESVRDKMMGTREYRLFIEKKKREKTQSIKKYLNKRNLLIALALIILNGFLIAAAFLLNSLFSTDFWTTICWNIIGAGVFATIISRMINMFKAS